MSQPLFGLVPAGYPVITVPTSVPTSTSFLYALPGPSPASRKPFSHIVVFLLPGIALPENTAAAIYLVTPSTTPNQAEPNFRFLGGVGPGKESAVFKISSTTAGQDVGIGLSIEPAESVAARMESTGRGSTAETSAEISQQQSSMLIMAQRIIKNAFNFLASFSGQTGQVEVVPLKAFEEWWKKFETRLRNDPRFLEREC